MVNEGRSRESDEKLQTVMRNEGRSSGSDDKYEERN